eukprot:sb/3479225/
MFRRSGVFYELHDAYSKTSSPVTYGAPLFEFVTFVTLAPRAGSRNLTNLNTFFTEVLQDIPSVDVQDNQGTQSHPVLHGQFTPDQLDNVINLSVV